MKCAVKMLWKPARTLLLICALSIPYTDLAADSSEIIGVPRVVDGDTLLVSNKRIRLHGIDAPEARQICFVGGDSWACGSAASKALKALIGRNMVRCTPRDFDRYGRIIGVCFVGAAGRQDISAQMVRDGWALAYRRYSPDYVDQEQLARINKRGLWRGEFTYPWDWRRGQRLGRGDNATGLSPLRPKKVSPNVKACCKMCRKGKACGNSCISRAKTCSRPVGCACNAY